MANIRQDRYEIDRRHDQIGRGLWPEWKSKQQQTRDEAPQQSIVDDAKYNTKLPHGECGDALTKTGKDDVAEDSREPEAV